MEISNIEITSYNIPLPEPVEAYAAGIMKAFDLVICRIKNDDGIEGVGYITVHENQGQAIATIIKNSFVPILVNKDPRLIELLFTKIIFFSFFLFLLGKLINLKAIRITVRNPTIQIIKLVLSRVLICRSTLKLPAFECLLTEICFSSLDELVK